nr:TNF-alpha1 [Channa argus]
MVAYTTAPGDLEMGVQETVVLVEKKSSTSWIWKVTVVFLIAALCFGGALLFAWYWSESPQMKSEPAIAEPHTEKDTAGKTDTNYPLKLISNRAKAAIHLEGTYNEKVKKLLWKSGQGQGFAQGGFKLVDNQITIPHTGLFFVYTQALFRVTCSDGEEEGAGNHATPLSHRIWRYSDSISSKTSLMGAVRTVCHNTAQEDTNGDGQGWYNAIYLGAVFKLNKGDTLWTETNQLSQLETEEGQTFFGVFAL